MKVYRLLPPFQRSLLPPYSVVKMQAAGSILILVPTYEVYGVITQKIMALNSISSRDKTKLKSVEMKLLSNSKMYFFQ
jgi:hypothetical protein